VSTETEYVCACGCKFPDKGIASEHVEFIHGETYEPGDLRSLELAIGRMISLREV